jgi:carbon-monoxide dehydrogenase medium subunit
VSTPGGTDQIVDIRFKGQKIDLLVGINKIEGLSYVREEDGIVKIGSLTNLNILQKSEIISKKFPSVVDATIKFASFQIRNRATIGGNICHSTPSADMAPPLLTLDASAKTISSKRERTVKLNGFFTDPGTNILGGGEIMKELSISIPPVHSRNAYLRHCSREALDIAIASVAAYLEIDASNTIREVRIALGAVATTPMRSHSAKAMINGREASVENFVEAGKLASREAKPISDVRSSAEYRRRVTSVLTKRALSLALDRCKWA